MGFVGYVAVCVQLYCRCFTVLHLVVTVYTTCLGLHGHLQVCRVFFSFIFSKESRSQIIRGILCETIYTADLPTSPQSTTTFADDNAVLATGSDPAIASHKLQTNLV
jgi:hypothetical protein